MCRKILEKKIIRKVIKVDQQLKTISMDNPNLIYHIPEKEITDTSSFLDAIKLRIIEDEKSLSQGIFLRGLDKGICIELVHPDFDERKPANTLTIHISYEGYSL